MDSDEDCHREVTAWFLRISITTTITTKPRAKANASAHLAGQLAADLQFLCTKFCIPEITLSR